jgi:hypothetical protein
MQYNNRFISNITILINTIHIGTININEKNMMLDTEAYWGQSFIFKNVIFNLGNSNFILGNTNFLLGNSKTQYASIVREQT